MLSAHTCLFKTLPSSTFHISFLSSCLFPNSIALCCALLKPKAFDALKALYAVQLSAANSGLLPLDATVMIAGQRQLFFFFLSEFGRMCMQAQQLRVMAVQHTAMCRHLREHTNPGGTCGTATCRMPSSLGMPEQLRTFTVAFTLNASHMPQDRQHHTQFLVNAGSASDTGHYITQFQYTSNQIALVLNYTSD